METQRLPQSRLDKLANRLLFLNRALSLGQITLVEYKEQVGGLVDAEAAKKIILLPEHGRM